MSLEDTLNIGIQLDNSLDDLTITEILAIEDVISTYKLEDNEELKGKKEYSASFIDGEELPEWISLDSNTGQFTIQPKDEVIGTHKIIVQTTDEFGESVDSLVLLEVAAKDSNISIKDNGESNNINRVATQEAATQPQISIKDVQTTDSSAGRELTFTISLNSDSTETITVDYATADNTAVEGED
ncbi:MAG: putative Ig domain-containing protein [Pleurocapsa sp.]